jgi:hypothetical protein
LIKWLQLPDITREDIDLSDNIKGRFTGDPAYEYRFGKLSIQSIEFPD